MLTLAPFTFCANNVPGTDPIRAMDMAHRCGFHTIELSAIDGISEQIVAERVSTGYVAQIERELQKRDLQCTALSAHCDMTDEAQFARLMKKIEFAGQIGARLVNVASCSFGKDSIATILLALEHGEPLSEAVYCEVMLDDTTSGEVPEHQAFIYQAAIPALEKLGVPVRVLRSEKTYTSVFMGKVTRGPKKDMIRSCVWEMLCPT